MQNLNKILDKIEQYDVITIFRHQYPDMDAIGSQIGLKKALQSLYPEKKIFAVGQMKKDGEPMDKVDDETIARSLGILLDTANKERVDDNRFFKAKETIRIDHHVKVEELADLEWIDERASATCELLGLLFLETGKKISPEAAQYIYEGLIADNIRFTTSNTRPESFRAGEYLVSCQADVQKANENNYGISLIDFYYETKVRSKATYKNHVLYSVMKRADYEELNMSFSQAKEKVYALANVDEVKAWALFTEKEPGIYNASLRSKTLDIRQIALKFGGGGHQCASGIKGLSIHQVNEIIEQLVDLKKD